MKLEFFNPMMISIDIDDPDILLVNINESAIN